MHGASGSCGTPCTGRRCTGWGGPASPILASGMVDMALWDLAAQRAGAPLWQLLGGRHRQVETYNTDGGWLNFTVDELIDDTLAMVDGGWRSVKMKVGGPDPRVDIERVRRVREALPDDVSLMVDVNQKWDLMTARRCATELAALGRRLDRGAAAPRRRGRARRAVREEPRPDCAR